MIDFMHGTKLCSSKRFGWLALLIFQLMTCSSVLAQDDKDLAQDDKDDLEFIKSIIGLRQSIPWGTVTIELTHTNTSQMLQSYMGVTETIASQFDFQKDLWRQEIHLVHPKWNRQAATLKNEDGILHDAGGNTLYGIFSSAGNEVNVSRPDPYDFRFLGLRFRITNLVASTPDSISEQLFKWVDGMKLTSLETFSGDNSNTLTRITCSIGDAVEVVILCDSAINNNPISIKQKHIDENFASETEIDYSMTEVSYTTGSKQVWFPSNVMHQVVINGELAYQQKLRVVSSDFVNRPTESQFQVTSLDLPRGRRVMGDGKFQMVIDNDGLRNATGRDLMNPDNSSYTIVQSTNLAAKPEETRSRLLLVLFNVFALIGIIVVVLIRRVRKKNDNQ